MRTRLYIWQHARCARRAMTRQEERVAGRWRRGRLTGILAAGQAPGMGVLPASDVTVRNVTRTDWDDGGKKVPCRAEGETRVWRVFFQTQSSQVMIDRQHVDLSIKQMAIRFCFGRIPRFLMKIAQKSLGYWHKSSGRGIGEDKRSTELWLCGQWLMTLGYSGLAQNLNRQQCRHWPRED